MRRIWRRLHHALNLRSRSPNAVAGDCGIAVTDEAEPDVAPTHLGVRGAGKRGPAGLRAQVRPRASSGFPGCQTSASTSAWTGAWRVVGARAAPGPRSVPEAREPPRATPAQSPVRGSPKGAAELPGAGGRAGRQHGLYLGAAPGVRSGIRAVASPRSSGSSPSGLPPAHTRYPDRPHPQAAKADERASSVHGARLAHAVGVTHRCPLSRLGVVSLGGGTLLCLLAPTSRAPRPDWALRRRQSGSRGQGRRRKPWSPTAKTSGSSDHVPAMSTGCRRDQGCSPRRHGGHELRR